MEQEHDLIRQIVQGENELFEQIVLKYQDRYVIVIGVEYLYFGQVFKIVKREV